MIGELRAIPQLAGSAIIATIGYGREADHARCLAERFDEDLTKPVEMSRLDHVLGSIARRDRRSVSARPSPASTD